MLVKIISAPEGLSLDRLTDEVIFKTGKDVIFDCTPQQVWAQMSLEGIILTIKEGNDSDIEALTKEEIILKRIPE